jgi:hypothetical protein
MKIITSLLIAVILACFIWQIWDSPVLIQAKIGGTAGVALVFMLLIKLKV